MRMKNQKALLVSTVSGFVPQFEQNSVELLLEGGYEIHYASNFNNVFYGTDNKRVSEMGIIPHQIDFDREPLSKATLQSYKQLDKLLSEEYFRVVHCHTPVGGALGRLVASRHGVEIIIYTVHGFHFYKGAPIVNNVLYRSAEKLLAKRSDAIITINSEDYANASRFRLRNNGSVYHVPGTGIDTKRFVANRERHVVREQLGIDDATFVLLSVGELNKNKNHEVVIRALGQCDCSGIRYLICGEGVERDYLQQLVREKGLQEVVSLVGYRSDVARVYGAADLFVFPSHREGLSVSLMEAMASGLPVLASRIRGNVDLIDDGVNGLLYSPDDVVGWARGITMMLEQPELRLHMGEANAVDSMKLDKHLLKDKLREVYVAQGVL